MLDLRRRAVLLGTCVLLCACAEGGNSDPDGGSTPMDASAPEVDAADPNVELDGDTPDSGVDAGPPCADDDDDGVCNERDACRAGDDAADADTDGVPDACDCDQSADACSADATCEDGDPLVCICLDGFTGDGATCTPVDCGAPPMPTNGTATASETTFGATATHTCDAGYDLVGDMLRTCLADGTWSGSTPMCLIGDCGPLVSPENGTVTASSTTVGADATYACDTGYDLVGDATRTCQTDGSWSGSAPTCVLVDCGSLSPPANGSVSAPTTTYGASASYACDFGYTLSGSATRTCEASGSWSGGAPTCDPVDCGALASPANGNVSYAATTFGSTATYSCNSGYTLSGSPSRTCDGTGSWSGAAPTCVSMGCGSLSSPANGSVSAPSTDIGDFATYTCNSGYQILGSTRRVCQDDMQWSGAAPDCGLQLSCGCGGAFYEGERVVATVDGPSGASGVSTGDTGTVIAGNSPPSTLGVLIEWDGWTGGHDGNCSAADCGSCTPSPTNDRWYVACDTIRTARLACSCGGAYQEGDRVVAIVDAPAGASGITVGHRGTVIAGNAPPSTLGVLIEWDGWTGGHDGNCSASECGACTASATNDRWYVPCDSVSILP
ncbi:MAG TPA: hypothetical protein RMH99_30175 [Sandaracinaceae bacterium LLY-WYZ-13_1]|nr:hypothetical protein [Sandaracinaceae bacterium LLY-WYZ-13_1]